MLLKYMNPVTHSPIFFSFYRLHLYIPDPDPQFTRPSAFFMVGGILFMAIFQLRFITQMLRTFEAVLIVPLYQCSFTIFLIIFGLVFFEEFEAMSPSDIGGFCAAVVVACVGIGIVRYTNQQRIFLFQTSTDCSVFYNHRTRHKSKCWSSI